MPKRRANRTAAPPPEVHTWSSLCIGVGSDEMERDARDVSSALSSRGYRDQVLMTGEDATQQAIQNGLQEALMDAEGGCVFVFVSAHGGYGPGEERCFVVPHGIDLDCDPAVLEAEGVDMVEIRRMCLKSAVDVVLVLDACYSGAALRGGRRGKAKRDYGPGTVLVASSLPSRESKYVEGEQNSVLTGVLLAVIRGGGLAQLHVLAEEVGLELGWENAIDVELIDRWEEGDSAGVRACDLSELALELLEVGMSSALEEPRAIQETVGRSFVALERCS